MHILISPLHNSQGQFGGNLFKKAIMEHFTSFSSITRYQECHNLTAIVLKNEITFFTSISLDAICKGHTYETNFFFKNEILVSCKIMSHRHATQGFFSEVFSFFLIDI